jgi:hypothetical protein
MNNEDIDLSRLRSLRVRCRNKGCGSVVDVRFDDLRKRFRHGKCPVCHAQLVSSTPNALALLAQAVVALAVNCRQVEVAFVVEGARGHRPRRSRLALD